MILIQKVTDARFWLEYDGELVRNGQLDVKYLAPALLAVGSLIEATNEELNGNGTSIPVVANADFIRGSFGADLTAIQGVISQVKSLFGSTEVKDAEEILKTAGIVGHKGYLGFLGLKKLLGKDKAEKIEKKSEPDSNGVLNVEISGKFALTTEQVIALCSNQKANAAADKLFPH